MSMLLVSNGYGNSDSESEDEAVEVESTKISSKISDKPNSLISSEVSSTTGYTPNSALQSKSMFSTIPKTTSTIKKKKKGNQKSKKKNAKKIILQKLLPGVTAEELAKPTHKVNDNSSLSLTENTFSKSALSGLLGKLPTPKNVVLGSKRKAAQSIVVPSKKIQKKAVTTGSNKATGHTTTSITNKQAFTDNKPTGYDRAAAYDPAAAYSISSNTTTSNSYYDQEAPVESYDNESSDINTTSSSGSKGKPHDVNDALARDLARFGGSIDTTEVIDASHVHNAGSWTLNDKTSTKRTSSTPSLSTKVWNDETGEVTTTNNTSRLSKSKHSLGWMAARAGAMELDLAEKRSRGYQTKAQTHAKYGW